jgi:hypothetical protein
MIYKPKKTIENEHNLKIGLCLWQLPDGTYIQDSDGNYLCAEGFMCDLVVEAKMRRAAEICGVTVGQIRWLPGFRKITHSEWEDQMERLIDGKIPDVVDLYRQTGEA